MKRLALVSAVFLSAFSASAFTLNSSTSSSFKGWEDPNISFKINTANCPDGVDVEGLIGGAIEIWNNVATSRVHLSIDGSTTSTTYSDPVTVYCEVNYEAVVGGADGSPGAASVQPTTGDTITSGVMYLNASTGRANIGNLSADVVKVVLAHEIGHLLGLGHSQDVNALMYYDASTKTTLGLAQDDIDAITYLYPRTELSGDKPMGCALVRGTKPPSSGTMLFALLALLAPLFVSLKLRTGVTAARG